MPSPEDTFCRMLWRIKHDVSRASLFAKHEMPTNTHEMLSKTRKAHQYPRNARPNTKCPPIPTKCSAKHEKPTQTHEKPINTHEMLGQTRKAHQYPRNARPNTKSPPIPTKCSANTKCPPIPTKCSANTKCPPIPTKCSAKHEMLQQTRKAHQYLRNARQYLRNARPNTKSPPKPDLTPGPSPIGRGEHAS